MSAIAEFKLIETSKLPELVMKAEVRIEKSFFSKKVIAEYSDFLNSNSEALKAFDWSGYIFADLFIFLEEQKGINLLPSEYDEISNSLSEKRQGGRFILTYKHKLDYLDRLKSENFSSSELIEFNKTFSEDSSPELATAQLEGIKALYENLGLLTDESTVILLSVG